MEIDLQAKIATILDAYPELEETLLQLSPAFAKLRNPILRRTIAKITSIQQAAKIAGIPPAVMVQTLRKAAGLAVSEATDTGGSIVDESRPEWFNESNIAICFDAGAILEAGQSPMAAILRLSKELGEKEIMELTVPFRPEPIIDVLQSKGFKAWYSNGKCYFLK